MESSTKEEMIGMQINQIKATCHFQFLDANANDAIATQCARPAAAYHTHFAQARARRAVRRVFVHLKSCFIGVATLIMGIIRPIGSP